MRIVIPLAGGKLLNLFGHCKHFALVDVDPEAKTVLRREDIDAPPHEPWLLPSWLAERGVTVVRPVHRKNGSTMPLTMLCSVNYTAVRLLQWTAMLYIPTLEVGRAKKRHVSLGMYGQDFPFCAPKTAAC